MQHLRPLLPTSPPRWGMVHIHPCESTHQRVVAPKAFVQQWHRLRPREAFYRRHYPSAVQVLLHQCCGSFCGCRCLPAHAMIFHVSATYNVIIVTKKGIMPPIKICFQVAQVLVGLVETGPHALRRVPGSINIPIIFFIIQQWLILPPFLPEAKCSETTRESHSSIMHLTGMEI